MHMDTSSLASGVQHGLWLAVKVTHGENTAAGRREAFLVVVLVFMSDTMTDICFFGKPLFFS
jgi:hypothetical protein